MDVRPQLQRVAGEVVGALDGVAAGIVVAIAGESGAGKTVLANAVAEQLSGRSVAVVHLDDFYHLPPQLNHHRRQEDPDWFGPREVDLSAVEDIIEAFRGHQPHARGRAWQDGASRSMEIALGEVLIVEGTWAFELSVDYRVFLDRDPMVIRAGRAVRARDVEDAVTHRIQEEERRLLSTAPMCAHFVVNDGFRVLPGGLQADRSCSNGT